MPEDIISNQMRGIVKRAIFPRHSSLLWAAVLLLAVGVYRIGKAQAAAAPPASSPSASPSPAEHSSASPQSAAAPQAPAPEQKSNNSGADAADVPKIRVGINEVNVVFTVTDKHGNRVTGLKENDFRIVDDNKPAVEIRSFHAETN